mmetsp:Transcript_23483/g.50253  ORF Transcript_23483/g.50253 Transcript_23483/m.50253 type:complete len:226 (-) Transcript_23483:104-781(-)
MRTFFVIVQPGACLGISFSLLGGLGLGRARHHRYGLFADVRRHVERSLPRRNLVAKRGVLPHGLRHRHLHRRDPSFAQVPRIQAIEYLSVYVNGQLFRGGVHDRQQEAVLPREDEQRPVLALDRDAPRPLAALALPRLLPLRPAGILLLPAEVAVPAGLLPVQAPVVVLVVLHGNLQHFAQDWNQKILVQFFAYNLRHALDAAKIQDVPIPADLVTPNQFHGSPI